MSAGSKYKQNSSLEAGIIGYGFGGGVGSGMPSRENTHILSLQTSFCNVAFCLIVYM